MPIPRKGDQRADADFIVASDDAARLEAEVGPLIERGLLCAEGRFVVRRLLEQRRITFRSFLLNQAALDSLRDDIERHAPHAHVFLIASSSFVTRWPVFAET